MGPGDLITVKTKDKEYTGRLMPNEETDSLIIKLDSGYNIGIDKKNIVESKIHETLNEPKKGTKLKIKKDPKKPNITILHTGGTIASKVDYQTGGVIATFEPEDLIEKFPELHDIANINSQLVSNKMSEDMMFADYKNMIEAIKKCHDKSDGIIIGHGTDTLGYSAAALSFALEGLGIPILLVGSQRSSDRGSSDAAINLINAAYFIAKSDFSGVAVCMHSSMNDTSCAILPGCKTRKMHTSRRDAFKAVNDTPIALVDYKAKKIEFQKEHTKKSKSKLNILPEFEEKVGLIKSYPNMNPEQFLFFKGYKGLVIEGTGLGHTLVGKEDEYVKAIKQLIDSGTIVTMTSQCIFGRVHPKVYTNIRKYSNIGVLYSEDMIPETAYIKLSWLLGNYPKEKAKELYAQNLRGEISERLGTDFLD